MRKRQKMYLIESYDKNRLFGTSFINPDLKSVIEVFIEMYPTFKGKAKIKHAMHEETKDGRWMTDSRDWQVMHTFQSTKELKTYVPKAVKK